NPQFSPGLQQNAFQDFVTQHGQLHLKDVINEKGIIPITELIPTPTHSAMLIYKYTQLSHYIWTQPDLSQGTRPLTAFESLSTMKTLQKKHITIFYKILQTETEDHIPEFTKSTLTHDKWGTIFRNIFKSS
ncbi:Hypothetical predicted protein, partial [Pelobates cultripes]